jgi:hypothetical protein
MTPHGDRGIIQKQGVFLMIRRCSDADLEMILEIINGGTQAYRSVMPEDRWHEPKRRIGS